MQANLTGDALHDLHPRWLRGWIPNEVMNYTVEQINSIYGNLLNCKLKDITSEFIVKKKH